MDAELINKEILCFLSMQKLFGARRVTLAIRV
jgi:hypothetical protein